MVTPLRVAFLGTPEFAVPTLRALIESRHDVVAVISQPDRPKGRGHRLQATPTKALAEERGIRVMQPERIRDEAFLGMVRDLRLDLGVVAAYGRILPESLLTIPRLGMINVHASLLPAYRGAAPVHRAVMDGQGETGVTIMRIVKALDAGPMMASARRPIGPDETSVEVERALAVLGAPLLVTVVDQLAAGTAAEVPQDGSQATFAPKILKSEGIIDWSLSAERIHNLVRGLQPWPLVAVSIDGRRYVLHRTARSAEKTSAPAGSVVEASGDRLTVAAGDGGILQIREIQPEGKRVMTAREFLTGHRVKPGTLIAPP